VEALWGILSGAVVGLGAALLWGDYSLERPPERLLRTNISGRRVPAVLGVALIAAALCGLGVTIVLDVALDVVSVRAALAVVVVLVLAGAAGLADDLRGDEADRGFVGHVRAATKGNVTGGIIKIAGVGTAGLLSGWLVASELDIVVCAVLVALTANLINLFDRAPGRALKISLLVALPLLLFGPAGWAVAASGTAGAVAGSLPLDLKERGMLGDAGANAVGATLGLGLYLALPEVGRWVAIVVLIALTTASEVWSFSAAIEKTPWLKAVDRWGRSRKKDSPQS
jgi:UDP-GlcNAc:undecaprenyl-phosphate GlcNAc-1-phosphate transferase